MPLTLDYNSTTQAFFLRVPRNAAPVDTLMQEYGLDFSVPDSTPECAILFTKDPFAAASFHEYATPGARAQLDWIVREIVASSATASDRHIDLPNDKELWPFQIADVDYIMRRPHALDGDEPGLGKTPTAIAVANEMQAKRVLVVCPASIRFQWLRRIAEWSTMRRPFCYAVTSSRYGTNENAEWTVVSYELARAPGILRGLVRQRFDLLIVDEAHYAKDIKSKRSRAIFGYHDGRVDDGKSEEVVTACLMEVCTRTLTLSGTPLPNRPAEAYVLCRALNWESVDWLSEKRFRERFNPMSKGMTAEGKVWTHEEEGRLPELQNRLRAYVMCRHLKRDVMTQLQMPVYDLIQVEETGAVKQALDAEKLLDIDPESLTGADVELLGQVSTVRKMMGIAMAPQVADYVAMLLDGGERKLVVFAWHIEVLDILCRALAEYGVLRVDGRDSGRSKDFKAQQFQTDPDIRVIIGNVLSLGTGTDGLQHVCYHALIAEPSWVPGENVQCIDRLDRGGQRNAVQADLFVAPGSIAEKVLAAALRKGRVLHKTLDRAACEIVNAA
jgi:SWI/SNF-related matrix-associated actin-dependent regulator 1 of chromatin subfamily A